LNRRTVERWLLSKKRRRDRYSTGTLRIPLREAGIPRPPYCPAVLKKTEGQSVQFRARTSYDPDLATARYGHSVDCEGLHEWTVGHIFDHAAGTSAEVSVEYTVLYLKRQEWKDRWLTGISAQEDANYPEWLEDLQILDYWGLGISGEVSGDEKYLYLTVSYKWGYPQRGKLIARRIHLAIEKAALQGVYIKLCREGTHEYL